MLKRLSLFAVAASLVLAVVPAVRAAADSSPSGQRFMGQSVLEPVYNDEQAGQIGYIKEPEKVAQPVHANPRAWAPFYLVVYPVTSTVPSTTTLLCEHTPVDNCPTHGNAIAALAQSQQPDVYGPGVAGHDHLMDFPGGPDFNIAWEPMVVLFTPQGVADGAVNQHILTDARISAAVSSGDAMMVPLPTRTFHCESVPAVVYNKATP